MNLRLARRMSALRASEIREILKIAVNPEVISFAGGLPAAEVFPVAEMVDITRKVLESDGHRALQYSTTEGDAGLRAAIAERMQRVHGIHTSADEILVTCGSQQGLDLVARVLLDPGDVVLCESPTYLGAINAFRAYEPRFVEVSTDDDGMLPEDLDRCLSDNPGAKMIYVVPDFQNPSGRCWSLDRRRHVLAAAARYDVPVVEDSPYAELRFEGRVVPPVKALDDEGRVVFLGTFSKTFCPGLRMGWAAATPAICEKLVLAKQGADLHTSTLAQRQLATFLTDYDMDANIARIRDLYRRRRDAMLGAVDAFFPEGCCTTRPQGGLFLWAEGPQDLDARELLVAALEEDVAFVPGGSFFPNGGHENTFRLNFSAMPSARISEGVERLGRVLTRMLAPTAKPVGV